MFVGEASDHGCDLYHYSFAYVSNWNSPGQIKKVTLNFGDEEVSAEIQAIFNIKNGDEVEIVERSDYPQDEKAKLTCIERAESRLYETNYSLACNNCESYVNWIFTNDNSSRQANSCIKNKLVGNAIDGEISRGVEHPLKQTLSGIIQAWQALKKELENAENIKSIIQSIYDLMKKKLTFLRNICNELPNVIKRWVEESLEKLFLRAKEFIETIATAEKDTVINGLKKIVEKGNQFVKGFAEAGKNVNTNECRKMFEKAEQFIKKLAEESKSKLSERAQKLHSPAALQFEICIELTCLMIALCSIYNDNIMTKEQKAQAYGREIFSSLFGVIGSNIGRIAIPFVGSLVGGMIGNVVGGAFGGTLFSFFYRLFQHPFAHLELQNLE